MMQALQAQRAWYFKRTTNLDLDVPVLISALISLSLTKAGGFLTPGLPVYRASNVSVPSPSWDHGPFETAMKVSPKKNPVREGICSSHSCKELVSIVLKQKHTGNPGNQSVKKKNPAQ